MSATDGAAPFRRLDERVVHRGHVITVAVERFEAPDGSTFERDVVHHPGAVGVVPLHDDGTVVLVRQFRAPLGRSLLEIPAGVRDVAGEAPERTAARELAEEVGLAAERYDRLALFHNSVGWCDEHVHVFLATGLSPVPDDRQGIEEHHMDIVRLPLADAPALIAAEEITDAKTVIGLTLALARRPR